MILVRFQATKHFFSVISITAQAKYRKIKYIFFSLGNFQLKVNSVILLGYEDTILSIEIDRTLQCCSLGLGESWRAIRQISV